MAQIQTIHSSTGNAVAEAPLADRLTFVKKVYGLLTLSIVTGVVGGYFTLTTPGLFNMVVNNFWLFVIAEFAVLLGAMFLKKSEALSMVFLFSFTLLTGMTASPLLAAYNDVVGQAAAYTLVAFVGLTAFTVLSKKDFSFMGPFLFVGLLVLVVGGLLNAFFFQSSSTSFFMAVGSVFLFSGFIIYDTSNIMRRYPTDQYISATLSLYLSILNLFLAILRILGASRD